MLAAFGGLPNSTCNTSLASCFSTTHCPASNSTPDSSFKSCTTTISLPEHSYFVSEQASLSKSLALTSCVPFMLGKLMVIESPLADKSITEPTNPGSKLPLITSLTLTCPLLQTLSGLMRPTAGICSPSTSCGAPTPEKRMMTEPSGPGATTVPFAPRAMVTPTIVQPPMVSVESQDRSVSKPTSTVTESSTCSLDPFCNSIEALKSF
mmetsp:Transcript_84125/g.243191  ORF Transcript_84125/g.243191 Transcript_84125/m.243191 type:complete len:208 (+) Transcript_84125:359-982(+)